MRSLDKAEAALEAFENQTGTFPAPLVYWWKSRRDQGCARCWCSSSATVEHPECDVKINRWFEAQTALEEFVAKL